VETFVDPHGRGLGGKRPVRADVHDRPGWDEHSTPKRSRTEKPRRARRLGLHVPVQRLLLPAVRDRSRSKYGRSLGLDRVWPIRRGDQVPRSKSSNPGEPLAPLGDGKPTFRLRRDTTNRPISLASPTRNPEVTETDDESRGVCSVMNSGCIFSREELTECMFTKPARS